jgi:DNA-binding SARP family transcriptional activator
MVKFHLLGPTELTRSDGQEISGVLTRRKELALLSYLALREPWSFCRRETLAGLLWPDSSESRARASLSVAVHHLRQVLGRRVLLGRGSEEIGVDPDALWVDVRAFLEAVDGGDIREAGALYRGDLLEGFHVSGASAFTTWLEGERRRLRLMVVNSLTDLADSMVETDPIEACTWARRATTLAPYDQKAHASLIRALARSSHQAEALQVLGALQDRLRTDLDLEPAVEIRAWEQRLRSVANGVQPQPEAVTVETDPGRSRGVAGSGGGAEAAEPAATDDSLRGSLHESEVGRRPADEASSVVFRKGVAVGAAGALVVAFALWALGVSRAETVTPEVERYELAFRDGQAPTPRTGGEPVGNLTLALSPDGARLVYVRREDNGTRRLWLRPRDRESASPLVGTDGARMPFFSPDGRSLGFLTSRPDPSLRVVPAEGGPPLTLVGSNVQDDSGATCRPI